MLSSIRWSLCVPPDINRHWIIEHPGRIRVASRLSLNHWFLLCFIWDHPNHLCSYHTRYPLATGKSEDCIIYGTFCRSLCARVSEISLRFYGKQEKLFNKRCSMKKEEKGILSQPDFRDISVPRKTASMPIGSFNRVFGATFSDGSSTRRWMLYSVDLDGNDFSASVSHLSLSLLTMFIILELGLHMLLSNLRSVDFSHFRRCSAFDRWCSSRSSQSIMHIESTRYTPLSCLIIDHSNFPLSSSSSLIM